MFEVEKYAGLTEKQANKALCQWLFERTGEIYECILGATDVVVCIQLDEDTENTINPFHGSHDSMQHVLAALNFDEVGRYTRHLSQVAKGNDKTVGFLEPLLFATPAQKCEAVLRALKLDLLELNHGENQ